MTFKRKDWSQDPIYQDWGDPADYKLRELSPVFASLDHVTQKILFGKFNTYWQETKYDYKDKDRTWKQAWYNFYHSRPDRNTIRERAYGIGAIKCTCHKDGTVTMLCNGQIENIEALENAIRGAFSWYKPVILGILEIVKPQHELRAQFTFQEFGV